MALLGKGCLSSAKLRVDGVRGTKVSRGNRGVTLGAERLGAERLFVGLEVLCDITEEEETSTAKFVGCPKREVGGGVCFCLPAHDFRAVGLFWGI